MKCCPECDKPYKHLTTHLKNKHGWDVDDIFSVKSKNDNKEDEEQIVTHKVSEANLEVEAMVRRSVDKTVMMHALNDLNLALRDVYGQVEASMNDTVLSALKIYRREGDDEIDGPRTDVTKRVREILQPSCQYLRECFLHELCRISEGLKLELIYEF